MSIDELTSTEIALLDSPKWRRRNSKWRHLVWWSLGLYGTFALWYVAARSRARSTILAAAISTALFIAFLVLAGAQPQLTDAQQAALEGTTRAATPLENAMTASAFAMVSFNFWMSFYLQKAWLLWVVQKKDKSSWVEDNLKVKTVVRQKTDIIQTAPGKSPSVPKFFGDASDFIDDAPEEEKLLPQGVSPTSTLGQTPTVLPSLDINEASIKELLDVPGIDEVYAERILIERQARGGFKSFNELRIVLGLKPHEVLKLESAFSFPTVESGTTTGRILDV